MKVGTALCLTRLIPVVRWLQNRRMAGLPVVIESKGVRRWLEQLVQELRTTPLNDLFDLPPGFW